MRIITKTFTTSDFAIKVTLYSKTYKEMRNIKLQSFRQETGKLLTFNNRNLETSIMSRISF